MNGHRGGWNGGIQKEEDKRESGRPDHQNFGRREAPTVARGKQRTWRLDESSGAAWDKLMQTAHTAVSLAARGAHGRTPPLKKDTICINNKGGVYNVLEALYL